MSNIDTDFFCPICYTVFSGGHGRCCGRDAVEFKPEVHGQQIVAFSNSWIRVYKQWKDHWLYEKISSELADRGSFGAATAMNEFIKFLIDHIQLTGE